ncbi:MAG: Inosose dehydratase [uncultured Truepera sp.]|uniref:Inosose dehydratase n=1 Tax=uncultured Truepera sp. TaxID=543023 RepID=A0A6J4VJI7_9DEIN|nr:MAG: Inosose dehydratase [uncultured Truepera sp.]
MSNAANNPVHNLAVQMYSLRELTQPLDDTLREVAAAGYEGIETVGTQGVSADELKALLEKHGLKVASSHVALDAFEADPEGVIAFNKAVGNDTVIVPWIAPDARSDRAADWQTLGTRLGTLAAACDAAGMTLLYHNHDFEMQEIEGKTALAWLLAGAGNLGLELDLAWVVRGGKDPLELLGAFTGRVKRVHVKDIAPAGGNEDEDGWADVGSGTLDWNALLSASRAAGAEWFVVEHDKPKDPLTSIRNSANYLKGKL